MEPSLATSIVGEVREFLASLRSEWPEIFPVAKPPSPAPAPAPAPLRAAPPDGDFVALFRSRAEHFAPLLGVTFGRISVKDQRTVWGSCTRAGNLNFNWRLTMAPPEVLDYLVVHELAHRAQMNHSRRFWEVVERVCPDHREHRRWLRKNGKSLYSAPRPGQR